MTDTPAQMAELFIATGAESSGKTTLCTRLGQKLGLPVVEEAARAYLDARMRANTEYRYCADDLLNIARIQQAAETTALASTSNPLICDTDLLVLKIWCEEKFGEAVPRIRQAFEETLRATRRHYLLCHWDIPWVSDPLRENPDDRERLFGIYRRELETYALPFTVLKGSEEERLHQATELILSNSRCG